MYFLQKKYIFFNIFRMEEIPEAIQIEIKRGRGRPRIVDESQRKTKTNAEYYQSNKLKPKFNIKCECGLYVHKYNYENHLKTKKHTKQITMMQN